MKKVVRIMRPSKEFEKAIREKKNILFLKLEIIIQK